MRGEQKTNINGNMDAAESRAFDEKITRTYCAFKMQV